MAVNECLLLLFWWLLQWDFEIRFSFTFWEKMKIFLPSLFIQPIIYSIVNLQNKCSSYVRLCMHCAVGTLATWSDLNLRNACCISAMTTERFWSETARAVVMIIRSLVSGARLLRRGRGTVCQHRSGPPRRCCLFGSRQRPICFSCRTTDFWLLYHRLNLICKVLL